MRTKVIVFTIVLTIVLTLPLWAQTYYVSSSTGVDSNDGRTQTTPFMSVTKVNSLNLTAGDQVLFKCGDTWRVETLIVTKSGTETNPITYSSYPQGCEDKPILSGSRPISGWEPYSGNIYVADLTKGNNTGMFTRGINQLFKNGKRLRLGRWPNTGEADNGYSTIDGAPNLKTIVDNELPNADWTNAVVHIKGMRWYIINREVTGSSGTTLSLAVDTECWYGCTGWGYFINNHMATLDQDGEWYYDSASNKVYLYSATGSPADAAMEGSVVVEGDAKFMGAIILGLHLKTHITDVVIENLVIKNWFANGITTPQNLETDDNNRIVIRNNLIKDVDSIGLNLSTWVWNASNGASGWRGGHNQTITGNVIDGANHYGITSYAYGTVFEDNEIRDIGLVENAGRSGIGCGYDGGEGACSECGNGMRFRVDNVAYSSHSNTIRYNRVLRSGYSGIMEFGSNELIENNYVKEACFSKGDCGGIHVYGRNSLSSTPAHDVTIRNNIVVDTIGNTDGVITGYRPLFGMGIYIYNYAKDVEVTGNTIINSSVDGILYGASSTGLVNNNTMYDNSSGSMDTRGQAGFYYEGGTNIKEFKDNILYGLRGGARTLVVSDKNVITASDRNYYFHPFLPKSIFSEEVYSSAKYMNLQDWRAYSGQDANSRENWFTLAATDKALSVIHYNPTREAKTIDLAGKGYFDIDQGLLKGNITLKPFESKILIDCQCTVSATTPRYDFDGDGKADVLWRNKATGDTAIWLMRGTEIIGGGIVASGIAAGWIIRAVGDFNADGKSDVLWQDTVTGDVAIWLMEGGSIKTGGYVLRAMPVQWELVSSGDFNGDKKLDVLWRNTSSGDIYLWLMDGTTIAGGGHIVRGMSSDWAIKAVADLDGDGKSDIVWQQTTSGDVAGWLMSGVGISGGNYIAKGIPGNWQINTAEDFDGNGKADVLWQDTTTGDVAMWLMDGLSISGGGYVARGVGGNWKLRVVADYSGDGKADVLWQETTTGDVAIWLMDGTKTTAAGYAARGLGSQWEVR
ncbi:MAG: FG-GAP-like repeat-containing protein [Candidatus Magnetobacterium sp. LHC-1]|nr:VCBS repeat-containing protein [Nitrospirota bacterium]